MRKECSIFLILKLLFLLILKFDQNYGSSPGKGFLEALSIFFHSWWETSLEHDHLMGLPFPRML